ncbi:MAG: hypothetical protein IKP36_13835 [Bacteroidaceae bacterium]|nr:hypothetical protein [Bacteroidaceae bacterium]
MSKLVCIFPENETTDFLLPVYKQLKLLPDFVGYRFDTNDSSKIKNLFDELHLLDDDAFVFFIGHGASNKLYGSVDKEGEKTILFDKANTECIKKNNVVGIACRSKEFADDNNILNYIGFGDITSDYSEVLAERNIGDPDYLDWASEEDIINFRNEFVGAIADAVKLSECKSLQSIYRMMKLCFNKRIALLLVNRHILNYRQVADMLYDINDEMLFKQESHSS